MADSNQYDVIVVGAGPAGGVAAYQLATAGCRVLLLEREKLPRYKACGGAVVRRALDALPFPLDDKKIVNGRISSFRLTNNLEAQLLIERKNPVIAMTMRSELDEFIAGRAVAAGAVLRDQVAVKGAVESGEAVRCETSAGSFSSQFLIGADGVSSIVARCSPRFRLPRAGVALEAEIYLKDGKFLSEQAGQVDFDFNVLPDGYGWVFPKADHLSAGVFTLKTSSPQIRNYCDNYLRKKGLAANVARAFIRGHLIPLGPRSRKLNTDRILLAGDAAGLADPLTGEGISYALRSGLLAAETILGALHSNRRSLDTYSERVAASLIPEIRMALRIARAIYAWPSFFYRTLTRKTLFANRVVDIFEGKTTYAKVWKKLFTKPYKLL